MFKNIITSVVFICGYIISLWLTVGAVYVDIMTFQEVLRLQWHAWCDYVAMTYHAIREFFTALYSFWRFLVEAVFTSILATGLFCQWFFSRLVTAGGRSIYVQNAYERLAASVEVTSSNHE